MAAAEDVVLGCIEMAHVVPAATISGERQSETERSAKHLRVVAASFVLHKVG